MYHLLICIYYIIVNVLNIYIASNQKINMFSFYSLSKFNWTGLWQQYNGSQWTVAAISWWLDYHAAPGSALYKLQTGSNIMVVIIMLCLSQPFIKCRLLQQYHGGWIIMLLLARPFIYCRLAAISWWLDNNLMVHVQLDCAVSGLALY